MDPVEFYKDLVRRTMILHQRSMAADKAKSRGWTGAESSSGPVPLGREPTNMRGAPGRGWAAEDDEDPKVKEIANHQGVTYAEAEKILQKQMTPLKGSAYENHDAVAEYSKRNGMTEDAARIMIAEQLDYLRSKGMPVPEPESDEMRAERTERELQVREREESRGMPQRWSMDPKLAAAIAQMQQGPMLGPQRPPMPGGHDINEYSQLAADMLRRD